MGGASLLADKFARIWNHTEEAAAAATKLWATEVLPCRNVLGESPVWSARDRKLYWVSSSGTSNQALLGDARARWVTLGARWVTLRARCARP